MTEWRPVQGRSGDGGQVGAAWMPRAVARMVDSTLAGMGGAGIVIVLGLSVGSLVETILLTVIVIAYFVLMEAYVGRTIGKMLLQLETVGPDGGKPTIEAALRRNSWYLLAIIPFGALAEFVAAIGIGVTISRSPINVGWHDVFAGGTRVVERRRPAR